MDFDRETGKSVQHLEWRMFGFISLFSMEGEFLFDHPIDTTSCSGDDYVKLLSERYKIAVTSAKDAMGAELSPLRLTSLELCDFSKKCSTLQHIPDTVADTDRFLYSGIEGRAPYAQQFCLRKYEEYAPMTHRFMGSIRTYQSDIHTFVIAQVVTGHEVAVGYITDEYTPKKDLGEYQPMESEPHIESHLTDIYFEPFLHHGDGFDLIIHYEGLK